MHIQHVRSTSEWQLDVYRAYKWRMWELCRNVKTESPIFYHVLIETHWSIPRWKKVEQYFSCKCYERNIHGLTKTFNLYSATDVGTWHGKTLPRNWLRLIFTITCTKYALATQLLTDPCQQFHFHLPKYLLWSLLHGSGLRSKFNVEWLKHIH